MRIYERIIRKLNGKIKDLQNNMTRLQKSKDQAYHERDLLVAALSKLYPAHLTKHPDSDINWERDWMNIVCIHFPTGQAAWHIHDAELVYFQHLQYAENHWDGHSTDEKYERLARLKHEN